VTRRPGLDLADRVRSVDWRAEAVLAGKVCVVAVLVASVYAFAWVAIVATPAVSRLDVTLGLGTVLASVPLFAAGFALAGARRPWVGGLYVAALSVLAGAATALFRGVDQIQPTSWLGVAGCVAVIYAMDYGSPTKYPTDPAHGGGERAADRRTPAGHE
jgi:hypothetical protein